MDYWRYFEGDLDGGSGVIILLFAGEVRVNRGVPLRFTHTCHLPSGSPDWCRATAGPSVSPDGYSSSVSPAIGS